MENKEDCSITRSREIIDTLEPPCATTSHKVTPIQHTESFPDEGGFPLSRSFSVRTHVNFTRVSKIEAKYGRSRVNIRDEPRSTFTFSRGLSYIASEQLRDSGNQPLETLREPRGMI